MIEAEHMRGFVDSRSRLELFLAGGDRGDRSEGGASPALTSLDVDFDASSSSSEFGDVVEAVDVPISDSDFKAAKSLEAGAEGGRAVAEDGAGEGEYGWARVLEDMADGADGADGK